MNHFSIKNLEQYQHYTDRKPIWIKLYCSVISDPDFVALSEHGKLSYLLLLTLASQQNNKLPDNVTLLTKLLHLDTPIDIQELRNKGFIVDYRTIATVHKVPQESLSIYLGVSNLIIGFLNDKAGKNFRETNGNREMIIARLKEGYTEEDCQKVIVNRLAHWKNTDSEQYLRPSTLFRKSKFDGYLNSPMPANCTERKQDKFSSGGLSKTRSTMDEFVSGNGSGRNLIAFKANSGD
jgi:uncharacterized phage protein (TIGR02220 family)